MSASLERIVSFTPAFDRRDSDPSKNYGVHGVDLRMVLKGEAGAVQFVLYTNWQLPHVADEQWERHHSMPRILIEPMPADLGYHSPTPRYEGQAPVSGSPCEYIGGKPCYYDGSGLNAERVFGVLLREGSEGVWRELQEFYDEIFAASSSTPENTE